VRVLITRPEADAEPLARRLAALGIEAMIAPMLTIRQRPDVPIDLAGAQALIFTSANGVRAFAAASTERGLAVFAVGDATARTARDEGFRMVGSAGGTVDDLAKLVRDRLDPDAGRLVHVAGSAVAGDLAGSLEAAGFRVDRLVLYDSVPADALSAPVREALADGTLDGVLFFSPRTAGTFVSLLDKGGVEKAYRTLHAFCLSTAVADEVRTRPWAGLAIAAHPTQDALIDVVTAVDGDLDRGGETFEMTEETSDNATESAAHRIIAAFGGIRPMASKLNVPVTTIEGWKQRDRIPASHRGEIETAAAAQGIDVAAADLDAMSGEEHEGEQGAESAPASMESGADAEAPSEEPAEDTEPEAAAETAESVAASAPPPAARKRGHGVVWAVVAVVVVVAVVAAVMAERAGLFAPRPAQTTIQAGNAGTETSTAAGAPQTTITEQQAAATIGTKTGEAEKPSTEADGTTSLPPMATTEGTASSATETPAATGETPAAPEAEAGTTTEAPATTEPAPTTEAQPAEAPESAEAETETTTEPAPTETGPAEAPAATATEATPESAEAETEAAAEAPSAEQPAATEGEAALAARVSAMEEKIAELESRDASAPLSTALAPIVTKLATLESQVNALDTGSGKVEAALAEIRRDIQNLSKGSGATSPAAEVRLIFDVGRLRRAVESGAPYSGELAPITTALSDNAALQADLTALADHADSGVATTAALDSGLDKAADAVFGMRPDLSGEDWLQAILARLQSVVTVRRVDAPPGVDNPGAVVAATREALDAGDLATAVSTFAVLEPLGLSAVSDWLKEARARLAADKALAAIESVIAFKVGGSGSGGGG
jgi:uroporphyrinogen-III synthase